MGAERLFVVVEYNQASGRPERVADQGGIVDSIEEAADVLQLEREHTDAIGRRETFEIFELIPVKEWT